MSIAAVLARAVATGNLTPAAAATAVHSRIRDTGGESAAGSAAPLSSPACTRQTCGGVLGRERPCLHSGRVFPLPPSLACGRSGQGRSCWWGGQRGDARAHGVGRFSFSRSRCLAGKGRVGGGQAWSSAVACSAREVPRTFQETQVAVAGRNCGSGRSRSNGSSSSSRPPGSIWKSSWGKRSSAGQQDGEGGKDDEEELESLCRLAFARIETVREEEPIVGVGADGSNKSQKRWRGMCKLQARASDEPGEGRGLYATCNVSKSELLLTVHRSRMIMASRLPETIQHHVPAQATAWARVALFLLLRPGHSCLTPLFSSYIALLPPPHSLQSSVFWSDAEVALLPPALAVDTAERLHLIRSEYQLVQQAIKDRQHEFVEDLSLLRFTQAYALVCSRAWCIDAVEQLALVPYADLINHSASCSTLLSYDDDTECVEIRADESYEAGQQVYVSYGDFGNHVLALDFGFVLQDNPYDQVEVCVLLQGLEAQAGAPARLSEAKRELLVQAGVIDSVDQPGATFSLRRVSSPAGQANKGMPHRLRALARVICATTEEQLAALRSNADGSVGGQAIGMRPVRMRLGASMAGLRGGGRSGARERDREALLWEARAMQLLLEVVEDHVESATESLKIMELALSNSGCLTLQPQHDCSVRFCSHESDGLATLPTLNSERVAMARCILGSQVSLLRSVAAWLRPRSVGGGLDSLL